MLLKEIINEPYKSNDIVPNKSVPKDKLPQDKLRFRGQGYFSDVYDIEDNPHEVVKLSNQRTGAKTEFRGSEPTENKDYDEGFRYYAEEILADNTAASNPYFPRVRAYAVDNQEHQYIIETLIPADQIFYWVDPIKDKDDFTHQIHNIDVLGNRMFSDWKERTSHRTEETQAVDLLDLIVIALDAMSYGRYVASNDKKLVEAMSLIQRVLRRNPRLTGDIHQGNVMFRRTRYGLQLVITDPFSLF